MTPLEIVALVVVWVVILLALWRSIYVWDRWRDVAERGRTKRVESRQQWAQRRFVSRQEGDTLPFTGPSREALPPPPPSPNWCVECECAHHTDMVWTDWGRYICQECLDNKGHAHEGSPVWQREQLIRRQM